MKKQKWIIKFINKVDLPWGLSKEQLEEMRKEVEQLTSENARLTEQLESSEQLPCKVGDTVWKIIIEFAKDGSTKPIGIKSGIVSMFQQLKNGQWKFRISKECDDYVSEFGKIYFITEAEAEARLAELKEAQDDRD